MQALLYWPSRIIRLSNCELYCIDQVNLSSSTIFEPVRSIWPSNIFMNLNFAFGIEKASLNEYRKSVRPNIHHKKFLINNVKGPSIVTVTWTKLNGAFSWKKNSDRTHLFQRNKFPLYHLNLLFFIDYLLIYFNLNSHYTSHYLYQLYPLMIKACSVYHVCVHSVYV